MASLTMTASFLGGSAAAATTRTPATTGWRGAIVEAKAVPDMSRDTTKELADQQSSSRITKRRDLVLAGVAVAACSLGKMAMAEEKEPERGTPQAKKKYAPICVTMPTARICHK